MPKNVVTIYPILLSSANPELRSMVRRALSASNLYKESTEGFQQEHKALRKIQAGPQFSLECIETVHESVEKIREAKLSRNPFSLMLIDVHTFEWETVRNIIEQIWECEPGLRCILCVSPENVGLTEWSALSRPEQWAILRTPFCEQEMLQLACCLGTEVPSLCDPVSHISDRADDGYHMSTPHWSPNGWEEQSDELESARDELAASRYYVENIFRSMADSLLVINADMTIGAVNPSLLTLLGYQEDDLVGESPGMIFGEEFAQGAIIENLLLNGSVSGVECSFLTRGGKIIPISVSGSMMQDQDGHFQGLVCVAQDITERKRMEREKLQLHEQLLDTSRQLGMAEVATGVLHNVGNVLNSINVSIGVITDLLNHSMVDDVGRISRLFEKHREDLGTYLSQNPKGKQVPGYLEKLSDQLVEERRVALLELDRLRENAGHAQQCVAAQQDLATPGGIQEPVVLAELVTEALVVNQSLLEALGIEVVREFNEIPKVILDKHQVLQILVDVIRNACQAMEISSFKELVVGVALIMGPPDSVCIEVRDSGSGIDANDLTKIFGQGYTTRNGGRGMGLHRSALMAKNMGGGLRAQSKGIGQGASFFLDLPGNFHFPDM